MSWLSKAAKSVSGKNFVKGVSDLAAPVFSLPAKAIQKATGVDWKGQLAIGAGVGTAGRMLQGMGASFPMPGANGIPGLQGGVPLVNGAIGPSSGGSMLGGFNPWSLVAPVVGAGADIYSAGQLAKGQHEANEMSLESARESMAFQDAQATRQMLFQERMSDTQVQRRQADLKAAGINPVLAGTEGASAPVGAAGGGAQASFENEAPDYRGVVGKGIASAMQLLQMKKDFEQADSSISLNRAAAIRELNNAAVAKESAKSVRADTRLTSAKAGAEEVATEWLKKHPGQYKARQWGQTIGPWASSARDVMIATGALFPRAIAAMFGLGGQPSVPGYAKHGGK